MSICGFNFLKFPPPFVFLLFALTLHSAASEITTEVTYGLGGLNQLTIQQTAEASGDWRVFESDGVTVSDRIELRLKDDFTFSESSTPAGWASQHTSITEDGEQLNVLTYFYSGFNPANPSESYAFINPATFAFHVITTDESRVGSTEIADLTLFASVISPDFGIIPAIHRESHAMSLSAVPEPALNIFIAGGFLAFVGWRKWIRSFH